MLGGESWCIIQYRTLAITQQQEAERCIQVLVRGIEVEFLHEKRLAGLPPEILPCKIAIIARDAIMKSFMNLTYMQSVLVQRDWSPYNQNTLDCVQILATAPDSVQEERDSILWSRDITLNCSTRSVLYSQQNLLAVGSSCLAGGADAGQRITNTTASVNLSGYTPSGIMSSMNKNVKKNQAQ